MTPRSPSAAAVTAFRRRLLAWYDAHRRDLPWRANPDPYRVWISEIMLQQTTVAAVTPYFERFLAAFPTVDALAGAPLDDVLAAWSGLGYYSRARNLHAASRVIVDDHGGRFPREHDAVLALPGIGRYTAAAILSIAFGKTFAVVDGNVARVLSRRALVPGSPKSAPFGKRVREIADRLVDPERPGDFNQAMMELGATLCTPRNAACDLCPVTRGCAAFEARVVADYPEPVPRKEPKRETTALVVVESPRGILLRRRDGARLMQGLWELPGFPLAAGAAPPDGRSLGERVREAVHPGAGDPVPAGEARHSIMNRRITALVFRAPVAGGRAPRAGWRFVTRNELGALGTSSLVVKALRAAARVREEDPQCSSEL